MLFLLATYRLLAPGSEWRLHREWFERSAMADLLGEDLGLAEIHKLYRCHDRLLEHKQALFDHLVGRWRDLFNISFDVLQQVEQMALGRKMLQENVTLPPSARLSVKTFGQSGTILFASGVAAVPGGIIFGWLGDRTGRRKVFMMMILTLSFGTGVMRFIVGLGVGGLAAVDLPLLQEFVPASKRGWVSGYRSACCLWGRCWPHC